MFQLSEKINADKALSVLSKSKEEYEMRKVMGLMAVLALVASVSVQAADGDSQLIQFKTGEVSFTLLQSDGVTPLAAAELKMLSPENGGVLAEAVSDRLGRAAVALSEGRYLLNVSGQNLSVLDVASDATLTSCRVVIPDAGMLVAGQEEEVVEGPHIYHYHKSHISNAYISILMLMIYASHVQYYYLETPLNHRRLGLC